MSTNEGFTAMDLDGEEVQRRDSYLRSVPRSVVMAIPIDARGCCLVHKRSKTVRSAPNCWSFPTGLHEHGQPMHLECARELMEEHRLPVFSSAPVGWYESISPDGDGWHWVIHVHVCMVVGEIIQAVNCEPDKHPIVEAFATMQLWDLRWLLNKGFHPSFCSWALQNTLELQQTVERLRESVEKAEIIDRDVADMARRYRSARA